MALNAGEWANDASYRKRMQLILPKVREVQQRYNLPDDAIPYIMANAGIESRWNPGSADGAANDIGLLQITPILAKDYNAPHTRDLNTQLDVIGQYYRRGLGQQVPLDALATGWNTGIGRAKQVAAGNRSWESITPTAAKYNGMVNEFVGSPSTMKFMSDMGINYTPTKRSPAVGKTMATYNIKDSGPVPLTNDAQISSLASGLTGMGPDVAAPQSAGFITPGGMVYQEQIAAAPVAMPQVVPDMQLDSLVHTDLGLGETLF